MKFTRTLSLALAAAAALSFTACDDSTSSEETSSDLTCSGGVIGASNIDIKTGLTMGTQGAPSGSFGSIQYGKVWNGAGVTANAGKAWDSVDIILFADSTNNTHASIYSPKRAKVVFAGSPVAKNNSPKATLFKLTDLTHSDMTSMTAADYKDELAALKFNPTTNDQATAIKKDQVWGARLDNGKCALLDIQTANETGVFNITVGIDLYR